MPKITGQNIPAGLLPLYTKLVSPGKVTQGPDGSLRLKKGKKKPKKNPPESLDLEAFQAIAEVVADVFFTQQSKPIPKNFVFDLTQNLLLGIVPTKYFKRCPLQSAVTLESIPSSIPDPSPPPYGFRTNQFLPTIPTYPDGSSTSSQPGYYGEKVSLRFEDKWLRWRKLIFKAWAFVFPEGLDRVLMVWDCTIGIDTAARGSRPMVSLNLTAYQGALAAPAITSTTPPIQKKTNLYWRFPVPPSASPFYHSYQVRRVVKPMSRITKNSGSAPFKYFVLDGSNRPMMGRGYNNNNTVQTSLSGDPVLWEIKPPCVTYALANGNNWTWKNAPDEVYACTLLVASVTITTAHTAELTLTVRLTLNSTNYDIPITQQLTGDWNWIFDAAGYGNDGALPTYATVRVIDVSCDGGSVILHIARRYLGYLDGARGFLLLTLNSTTSATVSTIADTAACNDPTFTMQTHNYGAFGDQVDTYFHDPVTFWCWFDDDDQPAQVQWRNYSFHRYGGGDGDYTGYDLFQIIVGGVVVSQYRHDEHPSFVHFAALDGYDDDDRIKGWNHTMQLVARDRVSPQINPNWDCRYVLTSSRDYYAGTPMQANDGNYPWARLLIRPIVAAARAVNIRLDFSRMNQSGAYRVTDYYLGYTVTPSGITKTITHTHVQD